MQPSTPVLAYSSKRDPKRRYAVVFIVGCVLPFPTAVLLVILQQVFAPQVVGSWWMLQGAILVPSMGWLLAVRLSYRARVLMILACCLTIGLIEAALLALVKHVMAGRWP